MKNTTHFHPVATVSLANDSGAFHTLGVLGLTKSQKGEMRGGGVCVGGGLDTSAAVEGVAINYNVSALCKNAPAVVAAVVSSSSSSSSIQNHLPPATTPHPYQFAAKAAALQQQQQQQQHQQ